MLFHKLLLIKALLFITFFAGSHTPLCGQTITAKSAPHASNSFTEKPSAKKSDKIPSEKTTARNEEEELNKKRYRLMFWIVAMALSFFVLMIMLFTISRAYRSICKSKGLGRKNEPTQYVDAWSMHKLPKDVDLYPEDEDDSEKDKS